MALRIILAGEASAASRELAAILAGNGYEVSFSSLEEVLGEGLSRPDLLIVLDESPETYDAVHRLKSQEAFKEVPLIVTLDQFEAAAAARALESGADEFLVQPFRAPEVLARVAVLLRLQDDRRLLVASQEEFNRIFHQTPHPLFLCDRQGGRIPSTRRWPVCWATLRKETRSCPWRRLICSTARRTGSGSARFSPERGK